MVVAGGFLGEPGMVVDMVAFLGRPRGLGGGFSTGKAPWAIAGGFLVLDGRPFRFAGLGGFSLEAPSDLGPGMFVFAGRDCRASLFLPSQHFSSSLIIVSLFLTGLNPYAVMALDSFDMV